MVSLLWLLVVVLVVLWAVGYAVNIGSLIWLLLVAALVVFLFNLMIGPRRGRWY
jgi:hypothetical protein